MNNAPRPRFRPLLSKTPVLAVSATPAGISILGEDSRYSRFERYEQTLQARLANQRPAVRTHGQEAGTLELNPIQRSMYRRLMYGLKEYSAEQIAAMSHAALERVQRDHKRCSQVLHRLKCDRYFGPYDKLLNALFQHIPKLGTKSTDYMVRLPGEATLNKLKISTEEVIACLIAAKLLPADFLSLSVSSLALR